MINQFIILFPKLFGCERLVLAEVKSSEDMARLMDLFCKSNAVKIGESCTPSGALEHYFFKVNGKRIVLICEEHEDPKLIAPKAFLDLVKAEFKGV
jgi:hypothetical protein